MERGALNFSSKIIKLQHPDFNRRLQLFYTLYNAKINFDNNISYCITFYELCYVIQSNYVYYLIILFDLLFYLKLKLNY